MPLPTRSRSLRQPGYAYHRLIAETVQKETIHKYDEKDKETGAKPANERGVSAIDPPQSLGKLQASLLEAGSAGEKRSRHHEQQRPAVQSSAATSLRGTEPHFNSRRASIKAGQDVDLETDSATGHNVTSGLPLPSQLSRSSSLRQPTSSVKRNEAVKRLHSRNASISESRPGGNTPPVVSTASSHYVQKASSTDTRLMPPPRHASTAPKSIPTHQRSRSSGVMLETGLVKTPSGVQNRQAGIARPQFSTYQQQFSPRKQSPQSTLAKSTSSCSHVNTDLHHITALQDELLQLQWMFLSSHEKLRAWAESGERSISQQHEKYLEDAFHVNALEQNQQKCINGAALRGWLAVEKGKNSFERVEALARCVQIVTGLTGPNERLSRVIDQFEKWYEDTLNTLDDRSNGIQRQDPRFIQPLGQNWAETVAALLHAFDSCLHTLQDLGSGEASSGLGLVLNGHARLVQGALDELIAMEALHLLVLNQEDDWIRCRISELVVMTNKTKVLPDSSKPSAAWDRVP